MPMETCTDTLVSDKPETHVPLYLLYSLFSYFIIPHLEIAECMHCEMLAEARAELSLASHLGHRLLFQSLESFLAMFSKYQ